MPEAPQVPAPYRTRLTALFAAASQKAVILRRGPKTHFRLIVWDLKTDTFTLGQWMKGVVRLWDLSPDGGKLIYWAAQYHGRKHRRMTSNPHDPLAGGCVLKPGLSERRLRKLPRYMQSAAHRSRILRMESVRTWTAISAPPYFTALAIWPTFGTWTGGGVFRSSRSLIVNERAQGAIPIANVPVPADFGLAAALGIDMAARSAYAPTADETPRHAAIRHALQAGGADWVDWISLKREPDMLFAADGRIYRLAAWEQVPSEAYLAKARLLADFRDMSFEMIAPSEQAFRW